MPRVLIVYGTTDGQTRKIAATLSGILEYQGVHADVCHAKGLSESVRPRDFDGVIVAASIHAGGYQRSVKRWVSAHAAELNRCPSAFLSVCLGILEQKAEAQREVHAIAQRFLDAFGWHPTITKPVAGALLYTRYNLVKRWIMKRIVAKGGGDTDTSRDYEYTDWDDLRVFAREFAGYVLVGHLVGTAR
jgi:menaquinone-dependent protoporphyrinogen oxidase